MRCSKGRQPADVPPHEQQVGHQAVALSQFETALGGNCQEVRQVLRGTHASGGAIDDDADATVDHCCLASSRLVGYAECVLALWHRVWMRHDTAPARRLDWRTLRQSRLAKAVQIDIVHAIVCELAKRLRTRVALG